MENLPDDFFWFSYNQLNPDLRDLVDGKKKFYDEEKSKLHYVRHGIFEKRKYKVEVPDDFNWLTYNELNPDLRDIVDGQSVYYNEEKSKIHYVRHGYFEGRIYKLEEKINFFKNFCFSKWKNKLIENNIDLSQKLVAINHPYHFTTGGGEKYISTVIKYFIKKGYFIIFFNHSETELIFKTFSQYLNQYECNQIISFHDSLLYDNNFKEKLPEFDYFFYVNNNTIPDFTGIGKINIYHCQFPFDLNHTENSKEKQDIISSYKIIFVNSEFTQQYMYKSLKNKNIIHNNIEVLYPVCYDFIDNINYIKNENTFVMIGRIFQPTPGIHNKRFEIAIKVFNNLNNFDYKLSIIGSVKDIEYYNYLNNLIVDHSKITIYPDISDIEKNEIIQKSKYYIQLTGMTDPQVYQQEHFGISTMECINYNCFPICYNGGYSPYLIKNNENGILVNNESELEDKIKKILNKQIICFPNKESFHLEEYTFEYFENKLNKLL